MYQHLLVPLDGSAYAETALEPAVSLASLMEAQLTLVAVVPRFPETETHAPARDPEAEPRTRAYLDRVATRLAAGGVSIDVCTREGVPADEILAARQELGADLIVMATHGARNAEGAPLGSTSWQIVHQASCPVLLTRAPVSTGG